MRMEFSLAKFAERVLHTGIIHRNLSINEIMKQFFFNKVFYKNIEEVFYKMNFNPILNLYSYLLKEFNRNMEIISDILHIDFNVKSMIIPDKIHEEVIGDIYSYQFKEGISYITIKDQSIIVSYIDMNSDCYKNPLLKDMNIKVDYAIKNSLKFKHQAPTYIIKAFHDKNKQLVRIEYNDKNFINIFNKEFPYFITLNKFLFIDDIECMIRNHPDYDEIKDIRIPDYPEITLNRILQEDQLVQYPYESFDSYLNFLSEASEDPRVSHIMMTIYRIGSDPIITKILKTAIMNGKKVYVNVELRASNEYINMDWVKHMQEFGAYVNHYSYKVLKVHSKMTLIKFKDGRDIAQIGTGNYHTKTATSYSDFSLYTTNENICRQVETALFNVNKIGREKFDFDQDLLVTKANFRSEFEKLVRSQSDPKGFIVIKCNSFDDSISQSLLLNAARKGCKVNLIVRGGCTWEPNHHNIHLKSIVWDVLEHSRVYMFGNENPAIYIGSLDLTQKKIDNRVETMVKVIDPNIKTRIQNIMIKQLEDTSHSWVYKDRTYHRAKILEGEIPPV